MSPSRIAYCFHPTSPSSVGIPPSFDGQEIKIPLPYNTTIANAEEVFLNLEVGFTFPRGCFGILRLNSKAACANRLTLLHADLGASSSNPIRVLVANRSRTKNVDLRRGEEYFTLTPVRIFQGRIEDEETPSQRNSLLASSKGGAATGEDEGSGAVDVQQQEQRTDFVSAGEDVESRDSYVM